MHDTARGALTRFDPPTVAAPVGRYSHGVVVPPNARWLYVSGQVGVAPDGALPGDFAEQARQAWRNVLAIVEGAGELDFRRPAVLDADEYSIKIQAQRPRKSIVSIQIPGYPSTAMKEDHSWCG